MTSSCFTEAASVILSEADSYKFCLLITSVPLSGAHCYKQSTDGRIPHQMPLLLLFSSLCSKGKMNCTRVPVRAVGEWRRPSLYNPGEPF